MSPPANGPRESFLDKVTVPGLRARKLAGEKISALTAYDYPSGLLADEAGMDVILVGDSLANTILGYENTLPVTLEEMLAALRAVRRAVRQCCARAGVMVRVWSNLTRPSKICWETARL